jgi:hypothetical protein
MGEVVGLLITTTARTDPLATPDRWSSRPAIASAKLEIALHDKWRTSAGDRGARRARKRSPLGRTMTDLEADIFGRRM